MVLLLGQFGDPLILVELVGHDVQVLGQRDCGDALKQTVDHRLLTQNQGNVLAEKLDRALEIPRQVFFVDRQFVQPDKNLCGLVIIGNQRELKTAEQQVVGVAGNVLQLQAIVVVQQTELHLDIVLGVRQEGQGVAQQRVMGFELVHQPRFFLDRRLIGALCQLPVGWIGMLVQVLARFQLGPEAVHLVERRDQRVVVVGQGDPRLEHLAVPLRVQLLDMADQVPGRGVVAALVSRRLDV